MRSPGPQSAVMGPSNEFGEPDCVSSSTSFADIMTHLPAGNEARQDILVIPLWMRWFLSKPSADLEGILGDTESRGEDGCCLRVTGGAKEKF